MILVNPKTKEKFEVSEEHGEMLLSQGFYKKEEKIEEQPKPKRGRPRKVR